MMQKNEAPVDGLLLEYVFGVSTAYDVTFDQAGTVLSVDQAMTTQDLLHGGV